MSIGLALGLIALLLSLWAINWASRAANAAERAAAAAEKSALAVDRMALAAKRHADMAATNPAALEPASPGQEPAANPSAQARTARINALVKELVDTWSQENSAWPLIQRHPALADDEVEEIIVKAFYLMGRDDHEGKQHAAAVLNLRQDKKKL